MTDTRRQLVIEHEGRPTHVVVPWEDWRRTQARLREAEEVLDAVAAKRVLDDPATDWIPEEVALRLFAGEHPVKVWRAHRGLTQAQLAAASGVAQPTIARLETGRRKGTVAQLRALAEALEVRLDTLAGFVEG